MKRWIARYWLLLLLPLVVAAVARIEIQNSHQADAIKDNVARVHQLTLANRGLVTSLQSAIVESCELNGNERAKVDREQLHEEISEAEHPDPQAFHALVEAGIPPRVIRQSEHRAVEKFKRRLARVRVVNCEKQYQISPGSGDRRRDRTGS